MSILQSLCCCAKDPPPNGCIPPDGGVCCFFGVTTVPPLPCNGLCKGYNSIGEYLGEIDGITEAECNLYIGNYDIFSVVWEESPTCNKNPRNEYRCSSEVGYNKCRCDAEGGHFILGALNPNVCDTGRCCQIFGSPPNQSYDCFGPMKRCACEEEADRRKPTEHYYSYSPSMCVTACVYVEPPPPIEVYLWVGTTVSGTYDAPWVCCGANETTCGSYLMSYGAAVQGNGIYRSDPYDDHYSTIKRLIVEEINRANQQSRAEHDAGYGYLTIKSAVWKEFTPNNLPNDQKGYPQYKGTYTNIETFTGRYRDPSPPYTEITCGPCCQCYPLDPRPCTVSAPYCAGWCEYPNQNGDGGTYWKWSHESGLTVNDKEKNSVSVINENENLKAIFNTSLNLAENPKFLNLETSQIQNLNATVNPSYSLVKQATKYVKAEINQMVNGETENTVAASRLAECMKCPHRQVTYKNVTDPNGIGFCDACGCGSNARAQLGVKVTISGATCPLNKWDKSDGVGFSVNTALQSAQGLVKTAAQLFNFRTNTNGS